MGLFGEEVDGDRAVALGLAWAAYDDAEVEDRALSLAGRVARDPALARRMGASFRRETAPGGLPWDVAVEVERSPQMWSLRRKHET
jgi:enoyl-CoA hydratase